MEHNDALITIVDENVRALYASSSYTWILGHTPDELLAWPDLCRSCIRTTSHG